MKYVKENIPEFEKTNVLEYHARCQSQNVTVAILETGFDPTLDMFEGRAETYEYVNEKLVLNHEYDGSYRIKNSHAQKEGDVIFQVAGNAIKKFIGLPTGSYHENGKVKGSVLASLQFIIDNEIDVVSCSIGFTDEEEVLKLVREAKEKNGTIFINAVGNTGEGGSIDDAVRSGEFIDIGAIYYSDRRDEFGISSYSTTTPLLEGTAPLINVRDAKDPNRDFCSSGTSFTAPYDAGLIVNFKSLLRDNGKEINQAEMGELMINNSLDLGVEGFDEVYGYGMFILPKIDTIDFSTFRGKGDDNMGKKFTDIEDNRWSKNDIDDMVEYGIITGFDDGTFRPTEAPTREQIAVMFNRLIKKFGLKPVK